MVTERKYHCSTAKRMPGQEHFTIALNLDLLIAGLVPALPEGLIPFALPEIVVPCAVDGMYPIYRARIYSILALSAKFQMSQTYLGSTAS